MQFNEKLKKLRAEKGISQSELAEKIYVSRSAVAKWENGLGLPSEESLTLIAEYFNTDKSELISDPETANVIISKNHTLSKQKLWIIALVALSCALIIVAAILIPFVLRAGSTSAPAPVEELIFETEIGVADFNATNYADDGISADNYFAPSRIFTYNSRTTTFRLPKILLKSTYGNKVTYTEVDNVGCTVDDDCTVEFKEYSDKGKYVYVTAPDVPYSDNIEYCINLAVGDMRLSVKVIQESIPVQKISVRLLGGVDYNTMIPDSRAVIFAYCSPADATYQELRYTVEKIVKPDGTPYTDNLSRHAYLILAEQVYLQVTTKIEVGAKIYIYVEAEEEQVRSDVLEIEVVRTPITAIDINSDSLNILAIGAQCWFKPVAYEADATFNVIGEQFEVTLVTPKLATLEYDDISRLYYITATNDYSEVGHLIEVLVSTPEGFSKSFFLRLGSGVKEFYLANADTGKKLENEFSLKKGDTVRFTVRVMPESLMNVRTEIRCYPQEDGLCTFNKTDNTLTISENAKGGSSIQIHITVWLNTHYYESADYEITIEETPLEIDLPETQSAIVPIMQVEEYKRKHGF